MTRPMLRSYFLFVFLLPSVFIMNGQVAETTASVETTTISAEKSTTPDYINPRFPGCEDRDIPLKYKYLCSQKKFVTYLERYIKYPKSAKASGVKGKVIVSFIVETDGKITEPTIVRSPDDRLSVECLEVLNLIDPEEYAWSPALLDGAPVRSKVDLPVDFRLGYKSIKAKKPMTFVNIPDIMASIPIDESGTPLFVQTKEDDGQKIYDDVELSPYFKGCTSNSMTLIDKYKCSREAYRHYVDKQIDYPEDAKANRIQGLAKVECVIEVDGSVSSPKLLRDPGADLGIEAMRIISAMKDSVGLWAPGEVGGVPVRTQMVLPVRFSLNMEDVSPLTVILDNKKQVLHDCIRVADPSIFESINGASIKKISSTKASTEYGEKGRYGVYQVRLPKDKGRIPASLRKQEEVEAYEMYFQNYNVDTLEEEKAVELSFVELSNDANIIVYTLSGRTVAEQAVKQHSNDTYTLDLSSSRDKLFLLSVVQKDLVHTRVIHF